MRRIGAGATGGATAGGAVVGDASGPAQVIAAIASQNAARSIAGHRAVGRSLADRAGISTRARIGAAVAHTCVAAAVVTVVASEAAGEGISAAGRASVGWRISTRCTGIGTGATSRDTGVGGAYVTTAVVAAIARDSAGASLADGRPVPGGRSGAGACSRTGLGVRPAGFRTHVTR